MYLGGCPFLVSMCCLSFSTWCTAAIYWSMSDLQPLIWSSLCSFFLINFHFPCSILLYIMNQSHTVAHIVDLDVFSVFNQRLLECIYLKYTFNAFIIQLMFLLCLFINAICTFLCSKVCIKYKYCSQNISNAFHISGSGKLLN